MTPAATARTLAVDVIGSPAPQGSKRHVGGGVMVESSKKVGPWRDSVAHAAMTATSGRPALDGPLQLDITFRPPTPPPAPPWPGAVLSGCVDEDGVPTWLAQAGQVRGEQVRLMAGSKMWMTCSRGWSAIRWVEVRAPRAVPEPETERVPWWEAVGREVFDQDGERVTIEHVQCGDGGGPSVTAHNATKRRDNSLYRVPIPVRGDGTVEVLKDGDR